MYRSNWKNSLVIKSFICHIESGKIHDEGRQKLKQSFGSISGVEFSQAGRLKHAASVKTVKVTQSVGPSSNSPE
jgi:hypothetical protein